MNLHRNLVAAALVALAISVAPLLLAPVQVPASETTHTQRRPHPPHVALPVAGATEESPGSSFEGVGRAIGGIQAVATAVVAQQAEQQAALDAIAQQDELTRLANQRQQLLDQQAKLDHVNAITSSSAASTVTGGDHAGTLACIRHHESDTSGGYSAQNPSSTASGAYQVLDTTWQGYAGYAHAKDAPPSVQDQWANEAIDNVGTRPWAGSGC